MVSYHLYIVGITTTAAHQPPGYTEVEIPLWVTRASDSDNYTDVESQDQPPEYEQVIESQATKANG